MKEELLAWMGYILFLLGYVGLIAVVVDYVPHQECCKATIPIILLSLGVLLLTLACKEKREKDDEDELAKRQNL